MNQYYMYAQLDYISTEAEGKLNDMCDQYLRENGTVMDTTTQTKGSSDGGPSAYYDFPEGCNTLNDLIEHKDMSFAQGNIFKAAYRLGNKEGITLEYDLRKIKYYADRMLNNLTAYKGEKEDG